MIIIITETGRLSCSWSGSLSLPPTTGSPTTFQTSPEIGEKLIRNQIFQSIFVGPDTWTSSWEVASSWQRTFSPLSSWEGGLIFVILGWSLSSWEGGSIFIILGWYLSSWKGGLITSHWVLWETVFLHQVGSKASLEHLSGHQVALNLKSTWMCGMIRFLMN